MKMRIEKHFVLTEDEKDLLRACAEGIKCDCDCRDCPFELKGDPHFDCLLEKLGDIASND
jgi:hypothetical protein